MSKDKDNKAQIKNEFMMRMYDQMFSTIDRSYKNIWNLIYIVGGGYGVLIIYKEVSSCKLFVFDIAFWGYMIGLVWLLFRLIDANYWLNRNLYFIRKIEERFLGDEESKDIFGDFRSENCDNKIHTSLKIEKSFVIISIIGVFLVYAFIREEQIFGGINVWYLGIGFLLTVLFFACIFSWQRNESFRSGAKIKCNGCYCPIVKILSGTKNVLF